MTARTKVTTPAWEAGQVVTLWSPGGGQYVSRKLGAGKHVPVTGTIANAGRANDEKNPRVLVAFTPDDRRWYPVAQVRRT